MTLVKQFNQLLANHCTLGVMRAIGQRDENFERLMAEQTRECEAFERKLERLVRTRRRFHGLMRGFRTRKKRLK